MKEHKTIIDELLRKEIRSSIQHKVSVEIISSVAARAARDIRVNKELDTILKTNRGSFIQLKPIVWGYLAVTLIIGFLVAIPILTMDSETVSQVPQVFLELGLASSSSQLEQTSIVLFYL